LLLSWELLSLTTHRLFRSEIKITSQRTLLSPWPKICRKKPNLDLNQRPPRNKSQRRKPKRKKKRNQPRRLKRKIRRPTRRRTQRSLLRKRKRKIRRRLRSLTRRKRRKKSKFQWTWLPLKLTRPLSLTPLRTQPQLSPSSITRPFPPRRAKRRRNGWRANNAERFF